MSYCINCGFCEAVCPTMPAFNYRASYGARGRINLAGEFLRGNSSLEFRDPFESCLDCYACLQVCPAHVNAGKVSELMKQAIAQDLIKNQKHQIAEMIAKVTLKYMDPLGLTDKCTEWSKGLSFDDVHETVLYTGHMYQLMAYNKRLGEMLESSRGLSNVMASVVRGIPAFVKLSSLMYDRKIREITEKYLRNIVQLLRIAGVKFSYLGKDEPYPGTLLLGMGYTDEFREYAQKVVDVFHSRGIKTVITVDPHTYDLLVNRYPAYVKGFNFKVTHYLDYLGHLKFRGTGTRVTYHEPCHFVRHTDYAEPLKILDSTSKLSMPVHSGKNTYCCGGPVEAFYPGAAEKISQKRFRELKETGAEEIVTACPICYVNLAKDNSVKDISEYLIERLEKSEPYC